MEVWKEYLQKTGAEPDIAKPIPEDEREGFTSLDHGEPPIPKLPPDAKVLTRDMLLGKILSKPKQPGWRETHRQHLLEMTHLHMDRKKLSCISVNAPNTEKPMLSECCPNLKIVFLQDNFLTQVGSAF